jgi:Tfp pilus assembly protein PilF
MTHHMQEVRLNGWKAISSYLDRNESTAKRWETARGLPVRRVPGASNASVYAYPSELAQWLKRPAVPEAALIVPPPPPPSQPSSRRRRWLIAAAIAAPIAIASSTMVSSEFRAALRQPRDPAAAERYLRGVHALGSRTAAGITAAEGDFRAVIEVEPGFAPAHVGRSDCYNLAREFGAMRDADAYPAAEQEAKTALALDPKSAGAYRALAFVTFWFRRNAPAAEAQFRQSLAISPDDGHTHHWFANVLSMLGRIPEAQHEIDVARSLDPESTAILTDRALIMSQAGKLTEARAELARLAALDPRTSGPPESGARLALLAHDGPAYVALTETAARLRGSADERSLARVASAGLTASGWPGLLTAISAETDRQHAAGQVSDYPRAQLAALRGDLPTAATLLENSLRTSDPLAVGILGDAALAELRKARPDVVAAARSAFHISTSNRSMR